MIFEANFWILILVVGFLVFMIAFVIKARKEAENLKGGEKW